MGSSPKDRHPGQSHTPTTPATAYAVPATVTHPGCRRAGGTGARPALFPPSPAQETNQGFQEVANRVGKTGALIREISAGSEEQSQGVANINQAVLKLTNLMQTGDK